MADLISKIKPLGSNKTYDLSADWSNIKNKPTDISDFTNETGYFKNYHYLYLNPATAGYVKALHIKIKAAYADAPFLFKVIQRGNNYTQFTLTFKPEATTAAAVNNFYSFGYGNVRLEAYAVRTITTAPYEYDIWFKKSEGYGAITIVDLFTNSYMDDKYEITKVSEFSTTLPNPEVYPTVQATNQPLYGNLSGNATTATTADKTKAALTFGSKTFNGSTAQTLTVSDLGLSNAMHFIGIATVVIADGSTTDPVITGYDFSKKQAGDVIIDKDSSLEYVWTTANKWERLGGDGSYKVTQSAVSSPTASGADISFIDTISQDANGVITATKKTVRDASTTQSGVVSIGAQSFKGDKTFTNKLIVNESSDADAVTANSGSLIIGNLNSMHLAIDSNEIMAKDSGTTAGTLHINLGGGLTHFGGDVVPYTNNTKNLGTSTNKWKNLQTNSITSLITITGEAAKSADGKNYPAIWKANASIIPEDGMIVSIKMPTAGHDYGVMLSLDNGTTYRPIAQSYQSSGQRLTTHYPNGATLMLQYSSTWACNSVFAQTGATARTNYTGAWVVINNYNTDNIETYTEYPGETTGTVGIFANSVLMRTDNNKWDSIVTSSSTATTKTRNTNGFIPGGKIWWTSYTVAANTALQGTWRSFYSFKRRIDFRYSSNCGTTLTAGKPVYLVGTVTNGLFYLDATWWTQTLPTVFDGKVYVLVGGAYTNYQVDLYENNEWLFHNGYAIAPYETGLFINNKNASNVTTAVGNWQPKTNAVDANGNGGYKYIWQQQWRTSDLKYTPSGGTQTVNTDTADMSIWLSANTANNVLQANMNIDGKIYAGAGFEGNLFGNAATASVATQLGTTTIGSNQQPIYLNEGTPTAIDLRLINAQTSFETGGWAALGGRNNIASISVTKPSVAAVWNTQAHAAGIGFGTGDTEGYLECAYNNPLITLAGGNTSGATDDAPRWYIKLQGTTGKTYTLPTETKTLCASDGSNASGTWGISITGNAATATTATKVSNSLTINNGASKSTVFNGNEAKTLTVDKILTQAQYDALGSTKTSDNVTYYISDGSTTTSSSSTSGLKLTKYNYVLTAGSWVQDGDEYKSVQSAPNGQDLTSADVIVCGAANTNPLTSPSVILYSVSATQLVFKTISLPEASCHVQLAVFK